MSTKGVQTSNIAVETRWRSGLDVWGLYIESLVGIEIIIFSAEKADEGLFRSMIGCLMYLTSTRPNIMYVVSLLSRYMHCASKNNFQAAKRVLRYVKGTIDYGIKFGQVKNFILHGYSDSDWTGCVDDMQSTSGYCFSFGSGIFSWSSKKQEVVAQSTAEAEYVAAIAAIKQVLWLRKL